LACRRSSGQPQQAFELAPVEPDHDLAVNEGHGGGPVAELLEFLERRGILADVLVRERDPLLRKKLFLCVAARSARLAVDDHLFRHHVLLCWPVSGMFSPTTSDAMKIMVSMNKTTPRVWRGAPASRPPTLVHWYDAVQGEEDSATLTG